MDDVEFDTLATRRESGVLFVTIDSSSRGNSLTESAIFDLLELSVSVNEDETVRCLALTGSDGVFCAGVDLEELSGRPSDARTSRRFASVLHDALVQLQRSETPLIVGINGVAAGAGFSLAATGDLVLIDETSRMEFAYSRLGLTGDGGVTFLLPRLVGLRRAKEIVVRQDPIGPEEAVELGLATETVPEGRLSERLETVANEIAEGPVDAYGATFRLMNRSFDRSFEAQLAAETEVIAAALTRDEFAEGYDAFAEERPPEFDD